MIASYRSGLELDGSEFALDEFGIRLKGDAPFSPDFILPGEPVGRGLAETEHVMYSKGLEVFPSGGTETLAYTVVPYFNRMYAHFCSHRHTPSSGDKGSPAVVQKGRSIYFADLVFTQLWKERLLVV